MVKFIAKYKNASLQVKVMAIFFVSSLLLTLTLGSVFYNQITETVTQNKERELTTLAKETANKIERFLFEREADIQVISQSQILVLDQVAAEDKQAYLQYVVDYYQTYDEIVVFSPIGETLYSAFSDSYQKQIVEKAGVNPNSQNTQTSEIVLDVDGTIENILSSNDAFKQAVFSETPYVSDIDDDNYILFARPLYDHQQQYVGVVVEKMNFKAIDEILRNVNLGSLGKARLISKTSLPTHSNPNGVHYETSGEISYVVCYVPIIKYDTQSMEWYLSISEPEEEALAIVGSIRYYFALVLIVTIALLLLFSYGLSKRITKPIRLLKQRTTQLLASHKLEASPAVYGVTDEVKALTHTFDFLLEELVFMLQKTLEKTGEIESVKRVKDSIDAMVDHTSTGMLTIDGHGKVTSINLRALELLGIEDEANVINKSLELSNYKEITDAIYQSLLQGAPIEDLKCEERWLSTLVQRDIYQNVVGMTVLIQSIEARERFEHSVIRAKKLSELGELSAGVAHEIRNPLASVRGYTQMAIRELPEDSVVVSDLRIVLNEVDRLDRLIERFMSFASPNTPIYKNQDMNKVLAEVVYLLDQRVTDAGVTLNVSIGEDASFSFDSDQIKQVLYNLILNAVQASKEGQVVTVASEVIREQNVFRLMVTDEGEGIPTEIQERIFSPFFTTRPKGTGLGLSICARIVENHHGSLELTTSSDTGTVFTIELPLEGGVL